jgi:hypothetical protein
VEDGSIARGAPADRGLATIPASRDDFSYLVDRCLTVGT